MSLTSMEALVKREGTEGIWMEKVPVPNLLDNEVLIEVEKTAICGTDLHIYNWDDWSKKTIDLGRIIGHEFVGHIKALGRAVQGYQVGDRVSAEGHVVCYACRACKNGDFYLCPYTKTIGLHREGAFAQFVAIPASNLWPVPKEIPSEVAAFFDPLGNAAHCVFEYDLVGEDVLITGAGPIGILTAGLCKSVGANHVVITDVNPYRLNLAQEIGASRTVNLKEESLDEVTQALKITEGYGVVFEMSGNPSALNDLVRLVSTGGVIALLGLLPENTSVDWNTILFKNLRLKGFYGRRMYQTWYKMTALLLKGFPAKKVLTHEFPASDFQKGFDLMQEGNCGKVILNWK